MPLKSAQEFIEDLVRHVRAPVGCAIALTERTPTDDNDNNWLTRTDSMPPGAASRYSVAVAYLCRQHPRIEWDGITEYDGDRRRIARWHSEVVG